MTASSLATPDAFPPPAQVILFDGVCGLCNRYVQFVLAHDRQARFQFATLQGAFAGQVLARHGFGGDKLPPDSFVLVEGVGTDRERITFRSNAALGIVAGLGAPWSWLALLRVLPRALRDGIYDAVARVRYRVFGRLDSCTLPTPAHRRRFLD